MAHIAEPKKNVGLLAVACAARLGNVKVVVVIAVGPIRVWFEFPSLSELEQLYPYLEAGGHGKPKECRSRHRVAIVIPFRDREKHLRGFLHNMHSLLTKQQLDYAIFVVDQVAHALSVSVSEKKFVIDWA